MKTFLFIFGYITLLISENTTFAGTPFWGAVKPNVMVYLDTSPSIGTLNWTCNDCHSYQPGEADMNQFHLGKVSQLEMARAILTGGDTLSSALKNKTGILDEFTSLNYGTFQNLGCTPIMAEPIEAPYPLANDAFEKTLTKNTQVQKALINPGNSNIPADIRSKLTIIKDGSFYPGDHSTNRDYTCYKDNSPGKDGANCSDCPTLWKEIPTNNLCMLNGYCLGQRSGRYGPEWGLCDNYSGKGCPQNVYWTTICTSGSCENDPLCQTLNDTPQNNLKNPIYETPESMYSSIQLAGYGGGPPGGGFPPPSGGGDSGSSSSGGGEGKGDGCGNCSHWVCHATEDLYEDFSCSYFDEGVCGWDDTNAKKSINTSGIYNSLEAIRSNLLSTSVLDITSWINAPPGYSKKAHQFCRENFIIAFTDGGESACGHSNDDIKNKLTEIYHLNRYGANLPYPESKIKTFLFGLQSTSSEQRNPEGEPKNPLGSQILDQWADIGYDGITNKNIPAFWASEPEKTRYLMIGVINSLNAGKWAWAQPRVDENNLIIVRSSFEISDNPYQIGWKGNLFAQSLDPETFEIQPDNILWDAGQILNDTMFNQRVFYSKRQNSRGEMDNLNHLSKDNLSLDVIRFLEGDPCATYKNGTTRGNCSPDPHACENGQCWKLGDIFHSKGALVGLPQNYSPDIAYAKYLTQPVSCIKGQYPCTVAGIAQKSSDTVKARDLMYYVGSNDGFLHAFQAAKWILGDNPITKKKLEAGYYSAKDCPTCGHELWSFIPKSVAMNYGDTLREQHLFLMDGSPIIRDVLFSSQACPQGTEDHCFRTVLVMGQGEGGKTIFALDITDPLHPIFLWDAETNGLATSTPFIGEIEVVNGGQKEHRMAAFFGSGAKAYEQFGQKRGLHIIDLEDGADPRMRWFVPMDNYLIADKDLNLPYGGEFLSGPTGFDKNGDNLIDTVYLGNTDGRMYRVQFSNSFFYGFAGDPAKEACEVFDPNRSRHGNAQRQPIYTSPTLSSDYEGNILVYFGTGDPDPNKIYKPNVQNYFWALRDNPYLSCNDINGKMFPISTCNSLSNAQISVPGRIDLDMAKGEKNLFNSKIKDGKIFFTTYLPDEHPCGLGNSLLYSMDFLKCNAIRDNDNDSQIEPNENIYTALSNPGIASEVAITENRIFTQSSGSDVDSESPKVTEIKVDLTTHYPELMRWKSY